MIVLDCAQGSNAWRQVRCGRLTASRAHAILARGRYGAESLTRLQYRRQLIFEQLTGIPDDPRFVSAAMERGRQLESAARTAYARHTQQPVRTSGFVAHDELAAGCSLDGHVGTFAGVVKIPGAVEIKAPNTRTHLDYLTRQRLPGRYRAQITHHLWITGAEWCDFVSYDDRLPPRLQLVVVRVRRDDVDVAGYARAATQFLETVAADVKALQPIDVGAMPLDVVRQVVLAFCLRTLELQRPAALSQADLLAEVA